MQPSVASKKYRVSLRRCAIADSLCGVVAIVDCVLFAKSHQWFYLVIGVFLGAVAIAAGRVTWRLHRDLMKELTPK